MMHFFPLVKHGKGHGCHVGCVEIIFQGKGIEIVLYGGNEHVLLPAAFPVVNGIIVVEEKAFPETAAGNGEVGGFRFSHDFLYHQGTGNNDVCPFFGQSGNFLPFLKGLAADGFHQGEKVFYRKVVVVELGQGIGGGPLVYLGQIADRTAYADDFHGLFGEPGNLSQLFLDEIFDFIDHVIGHGPGGMKHFCQGHGAQRDTDGVYPFLVFDQGNFYAGAAQIKEEEILSVNGVGYAGKSQGRFGFSADNGHGNAGIETDPFQEGSAVHCISDGGGGYSQHFFYFLHGHDMGVHGKALQCPLLGFFRELPGIEGHAFRQADGFLFLIDQFVRTVGSNLHDDKADGVGA